MRNDTLQIFCHAFLYVGSRFLIVCLLIGSLVDLIWKAGWLNLMWNNAHVAFLLCVVASVILTYRVKRALRLEQEEDDV